MGKQKEVILLIVEGQNDEDLLTEYIEEEFAEVGDKTYRFEVTDGDILSRPSNNLETNPVKKVNDVLNKFMKEKKFRIGDIAHIFQVIDVDGILASSDTYQVREQLTSNHEYDLMNNKIYFRTQNILNATSRIWDNKLRLVNRLAKTDKIRNRKYKLLYFSVTSEHVIANQIYWQQDDKFNAIDAFQDQYPDLSSLRSFLKKENLVYQTNDIQESWAKLLAEEKLIRKTNINLLFDEIEKILLKDENGEK